jgi:hypothetical protein
MNRSRVFRQYTLDDEAQASDKGTQTVVGEEHVMDTTEGDVGLYAEIRKYRGLRGITDEQARRLLSLLDQFGLPAEALEGPRREIRTAVTAHMTPEFLHRFRELAGHYGLSPSNLARVVLRGWANSDAHPPPAADE